MNKPLRIVLLLSLVLCLSQFIRAQDPEKTTAQSAGGAENAPPDTRIPRNSKVYIAPMDGFETYLAAAFRKKEVPLTIVTEPEFADFTISGTHAKKSAGWAKTIFMGDARSSASASIQVVNIKTKVVVYADSSDRGSANRGERSTAEKLAKYLKQKIEEDEKKSR